MEERASLQGFGPETAHVVATILRSVPDTVRAFGNGMHLASVAQVICAAFQGITTDALGLIVKGMRTSCLPPR